MRLLSHLKKQVDDEDSNTFRMLSLKLVKKRTKHEETIRKVAEEYNLEMDSIIKLREILNSDLKKRGYKGSEMFDFVLDEGKNVESIKLEKRKKDIIKRRHLELEDQLAEIQKKFEEKLKNIYK